MGNETYCVRIKTDGRIYAYPCDDGEPTLKQLQEIVGGYIECAETDFEDLVLVVNEEGKFMGLDENEAATEIMAYNMADFVVGDAALVKRDGEDLVGITKDEALAVFDDVEFVSSFFEEDE